MLRQKPLVVSLVLAGLIATTDAGALGLGRLNVTSPLGQPLVAEVDLTVAPGEDVDSIRANVASPAVYRAANVEYQGVVQTIRAQVQRRPNGQPYLRLVSSQSLNDPYLDLLLEVNSSTGRLVREYVFLLDPPGASASQSVEPTQPSLPSMPARATSAAPVAPSAPVTRPSSAGSAKPTAPSGDGTSYTVKSGDTLSGIAGRNLAAGATIEQLMIAIQRANPNAFAGGNINRLRAGATLNVPSGSDAQGISQNNAVSEVRAQTASWRGYVARVADSVPSVAMDQAAARATGKVSGAVADTGGGVSASDKLKLSQGERNKPSSSTESKVAATKALKEEQSRTAQLEKIKRDQERVLTLKSEALAEAQAKAKAATPPPAPIPPVAVAKVEPPKVVAPPPPPPAPVVAPPPPPPAPIASPPPPAPAPTPEPVVTPPPPPPPPPVAVAPPPAPVAPPSVAKAPAPAPKAEPSVLDGLGDNPLPLAAGGLGVLALLGAFLWSRGRKKTPSSSANSKMADPVVNTMNPDTVFGTSGLGVVKTNDMPVQSQFSRSGMGTIDSGEVDPVAEAEVYIAYGREAQAEEILREALLRDPQRLDVATKLAEISATQGKRDVFDKLAGDVAALDRNNDYKQKLAAIAATHFPGHPLAEGANPPSARGVNSVVKVIAPVAAVDDGQVTIVSTAGFAALETPTATGASAAAAEALAKVPASSSLDFVLDGMTIAKPSGSPPPAPAPIMMAVAEPVVSSMSGSPNRKSLEQDLAELEASLKKATSTGQMPEGGMDFTDFSTATPTNLGTVGPSMRPEMLDLSFDAGRQGFVDPTPSILDGQWHDASTKLDLARAYEEMGDREGAREILREVIHDGDEAQQAEAKAMLAKLGG